VKTVQTVNEIMEMQETFRGPRPLLQQGSEGLMRLNRKVLAAVWGLALALGLSGQAFGWNDRGHMTVAYIAYQQLTPATRDRANALLKLNPKYNDWAATVEKERPTASADDKNLMIFMIAATWPDQIKRDSTYTKDGSQGGNRPDGSPDPGRNTGYDDLLMHKYWHFIDTPFTTEGTALPAIPTPNAQERIALFRAVLASGSADGLKSYDLTWLLHLVGDVHQPLHASTRVSSTDPDGDSGGNSVKLGCTKCELHAYWDDLLGTQNNLQAVTKAARKLPKSEAALAAKCDEKDWIAESFTESQQTVYAAPIAAGDGPFTLTTQYRKNAGKLAKERVALAGARLANLLNAELK
jgi:S1/P1 Nuclease